MKKTILKLILAVLIAYNLYAEKIIDVQPNFRKNIQAAENKHLYIKQNLPILINKYPTMAALLTCEAIRQDADNKDEYMKIFNAEYKFSKNTRWKMTVETNKLKNTIICDCETPRNSHDVSAQVIPGSDILRYGSLE